MRHFLFLVALICCNPNLFCQIDTTSTKSDTVFYKIELGFLTSTKRENAEGFGFKSPYNPQNYTKKIKYLQSETPMVSYECYDKKITEGDSTSILNLRNGLYEEWYLSSEKRVSCYYRDDKLDGTFKVFHKNGKLKRSEIWVSGEWKSGECFDENGTKIPYCSYQEQAQFVGGMPSLFEFLSKEIKYPKKARKDGVEGTIYVGFIVEKDGSISNIVLKRGVEKSLNEEAMKVVKAMPKWKAGKFEGELVRSEFTLPIKFKLD